MAQSNHDWLTNLARRVTELEDKLIERTGFSNNEDKALRLKKLIKQFGYLWFHAAGEHDSSGYRECMDEISNISNSIYEIIDDLCEIKRI